MGEGIFYKWRVKNRFGFGDAMYLPIWQKRWIISDAAALNCCKNRSFPVDHALAQTQPSFLFCVFRALCSENHFNHGINREHGINFEM